jgi:hypothetical protein
VDLPPPYGLVGFDPFKGIPAKEKLVEYGMVEEARSCGDNAFRSVTIKGSLLTHRKAGSIGSAFFNEHFKR